MSNPTRKTWYSDSRQLIDRFDRWVSRRHTKPQSGHEADWLGWDGWVRTENPPTRPGVLR